MHGDELDERLRRAAEADPAAVERVVGTALNADAATARGASRLSGSGGLTFGVAAACVVAVAALVAWWTTRPVAPAPVGVYRAEALPPPPEAGPSPVAPDPAPAAHGVYRARATPAVAPNHVFRVMSDDGTTWILSTNGDDERLPRGSAIVIGGEEEE